MDQQARRGNYRYRKRRRSRSPPPSAKRKRRSRSRPGERRPRGPSVGRNMKPSSTVLIRGIPPSGNKRMVEDVLHEAEYLQFVKMVRVLFARQTGQCRGSCYVDFDSEATALKFVEKHNDKSRTLRVGGEPVRVSIATSNALDWVCDECGTRNFAKRQECFQCEKPRYAQSGYKSGGPSTENRTIQVMELPAGTTREDVIDALQDLANVRAVTFAKDPKTGCHKGYGFVELDFPGDVERVVRACEVSPVLIKGQVIRIAEPSIAPETWGTVAQPQTGLGNHMWQQTATLAASRDFPPSFETADTAYHFDPSSGLYYEPGSAFYYDARNKVYYSTVRKQYYQWNSKTGFIEYVPPVVQASPVKELAPSTDNGNQCSDVQVDQFLGEMLQDSDIKSSLIENETKTMKSKSISPENESESKSTDTQGKQDSRRPANYRVKNLVSIAITSGPLSEDMPEVNDKKKDILDVYHSKKEPHPKVKKKKISANLNKAVVPSASSKKLAQHGALIQNWKKKQRIVCVICRRKFKKHETLLRHEQDSEMHKKNLAKLSVPANGQNTRNLPISLAAPSTTKAATASAKAAGYRDRAADRRERFGQDARTKSLSGQSDAKEPSSSQPPAPIDTSTNKGAMLLKAMGWKDGEGLGKHRDGIVEPVAPSNKLDTSGLGSVYVQVGDSRKEIVRKEMIKRL